MYANRPDGHDLYSKHVHVADNVTRQQSGYTCQYAIRINQVIIISCASWLTTFYLIAAYGPRSVRGHVEGSCMHDA